MTEGTNRRVVKPAKTLIDESGFGYEEGAIYSSKKAVHELSEPDAWLVPWCRANGDAGTNVYVKESDARNAAKNLEVYSRSETTADVIPLYAANHLPDLPQEAWQPIATAPKIPKGCSTAKPFLAWCPDAIAPDGGDQRVVWWEPNLKGGCWWSDRDLKESPTLWKPLGASPLPATPVTAGET